MRAAEEGKLSSFAAAEAINNTTREADLDIDQKKISKNDNTSRVLISKISPQKQPKK